MPLPNLRMHMRHSLTLAVLAAVALPLLTQAANASSATQSGAHPAPSAHATALAGQAAATRMEDCGNLSNAMLAALAKGDFKAATTHFDTKLQTQLSTGQLQTAWMALRAQVGKLESRGTPQNFMYQSMSVTSTRLHFANADLNAQVFCDRQGLISGFRIQPWHPASGATR